MIPHWSTAVIEALRALDREQAPHGLYGLREACQTAEWLPKLSAVLNQPSVQFARRIGCERNGKPLSRYRDDMQFELPEPRVVELEFRAYADTKVRKFGNAYRLDNASRVQHEFPTLSRELPGLTKAARGNYGSKSAPRSFGLLLIGHFRSGKDEIEMCRQAMVPDFLDRYGLTCVGDSWPDIYGRDFRTSLRLWYVDQLPVRPPQTAA